MTTQTKLALNGPADLVSAVPYLLGFEPEHSLVIVCLKDGQLACTFRVDLPGSIDHLDRLPNLTAQAAVNDCEGAVLIAYGEPELATACLDRTALDFRADDITVIDTIRVTDGRYYNPTCADSCCPAEGLPIAETTAIGTALAAAGMARHPDRAAISALLAPADPARRALVATAVDDAVTAEAELSWAEQRQMDLAAVDSWIGAADLPDSPADIALLGLAIGDLDVRDHALIASDIDPNRNTDLWLWVARHLEDDLAVPALTAAGWCAYRSGNGVLALEAFEQALKYSPHYRLAQMLFEALQVGIPPHVLSALTAGRANA
ncbi:DUF4192 domain-containing protein [Glycomyces sp. NPDC021274]|uniref:DUF4192 domain-containing protein n=1 Tax=Glycomyces sp. NPDC021274 TaxID=3155120 RepID=UPI0033E97334